MAAKYRGVKAWVETLIQYLVIDKTHAERRIRRREIRDVSAAPR